MAGGARWLTPVLRVGLIAGTLDIGEDLIFCAVRHIPPGAVFRFIASGLLGMRAFAGGAGTVAAGVAIHYGIALTWTAVYAAASRRWPVLVRRPVWAGLGFGLLVYLAMNGVVLPLTRVPHPAAVPLATRINAVAALLLCFGPAVAIGLAREARAHQRKSGRPGPVEV